MLAFEARLPRDHGDWWCANVRIDDFAGHDEVSLADDCEVPILVGDNEGNPLDGELVFDGLALAVAGGKSSCSLKKLREALAKPVVAFRPAATGTRIEGRLALR